MILTIDVTGKEFVVTRVPSPKMDSQGEQRLDRESGLPLWTVQLVVTDDDGGEIINVMVDGDRPDLEIGDTVDVVGLVAKAWASGGRGGISLRAEKINPVED